MIQLPARVALVGDVALLEDEKVNNSWVISILYIVIAIAIFIHDAEL